ncbi:MAG: PDZ domain-containing protein, partial [Clostridia bacterium]|nr:PDZ domain-containing protein [Clostridia bacterium]
LKGELIGIVNMKSIGENIEGIGFAIPINQALSVTEQLLTYGYVRGKPMIGVSFVDVSGSNYFFYYSVKAGVYVRSLTKGMNDNVLKEGDRIIAVNGEEIGSSDDIKAIVSSSAIGDKLTFSSTATTSSWKSKSPCSSARRTLRLPLLRKRRRMKKNRNRQMKTRLPRPSRRSASPSRRCRAAFPKRAFISPPWKRA